MEKEKMKIKMRTRVAATILVMVLLSFVGVAGVVSYLSNTVTATVTVRSPMSVTFGDGLSSKSFDLFGGETIAFDLNVSNLSGIDQNVFYPVIDLNSPVEFVGSEFDSAQFGDFNLNQMYFVKPDGSLELFSNVSASHLSNVKLYFSVDGNVNKYTHSKMSTKNIRVNFLTSQGINGSIQIKSCVLINLSEAC